MKQHIIIGDNLIGEDILSKYSIDITKLNGAESIRKIMACDIDNYQNDTGLGNKEIVALIL